MRFQYCPDCGEKLILREIGDEGMVPFCEKCNRPRFDMFSTCMIALVVNDQGEAAVLRQNYISTEYCTIVSGYMKPGEEAEETTIREVREELGLEVDRLEFAGTYWYGEKDMLMIGFFAHTTQRDFKLSPEVDEALWVSPEKALHMVHPKGTISYAIVERYLEKYGTK
jgi:NAD+ diphosphatase